MNCVALAEYGTTCMMWLSYLRRLRAVGVTEAVGEEEEEDMESWEEAEPRAAPSGLDLSLFISSLLLRETGRERRSTESTMSYTLE